MTNILSKRAKLATDYEDILFKSLQICNSNPFDAVNNPSGYVDLGTEKNKFCEDVVGRKLKAIWRFDSSMLGYRQGRGSWQLRNAMAKILTEVLESHEPVSPDDLFFSTGVTCCIDLIAHCLADPGEVFLVPTTLIGRIKTDMMVRSLVEVFPIPVFTDDSDDNPVLTMEKIIGSYESALASNKVVRGIFMTNPYSPLGDERSTELLMDLMKFCNQNSLHLICDEVYALSGNSEHFHSLLKFRNLPDPQRIHTLYGLSKVYGIADLRVGVIHTKCKELQTCLEQLCYFQCLPSPVMENVTTLFKDLDWCQEYASTYRSRLAKNYEYCVDYLKELGIKVRDCPVRVYLWADLRYLCGKSFDGERDLFNFLLRNYRLYICPGKEYSRREPGWFQIAVSQRCDILKEGLNRLRKALENYESSRKIPPDTVLSTGSSEEKSAT